MADRFPLVVNNTTNQITEVMSGDNLLFDNTDLITSTGDLVLDPAGDVDIKADLKNTVDPNLKVDDDLFVTGNVGIGIAPTSSTELKIEETWNNNASTWFGLDMDITPTAIAVGSRLLRLSNSGTPKLTVDVDGNTDIQGTLNVEGATTIDDTFDVTGATTLGSTLGVTGNTTIGGTLGVTGATTLGSTLGVTGVSTFSNSVVAQNTLSVSGVATFSSAIDANSTLNVQGISTFQTHIVPSTDEGASIGSSLLPWASAHIGEITIANGATGNDDNTITTATGDLYLNSAGGNVRIDDNIVHTNGNLTIDNGTITVTSSTVDSILQLISTDSGNTIAPDLWLYRNSTTPADDDDLGKVGFWGNTSTGAKIEYAKIHGTMVSINNSAPQGAITFVTRDAGNGDVDQMTIDSTGVTITGNLTVNGTQTILDTTTVRIEDNTLELRKGDSITGADGGLRINRTTDANGAVTSYNQLTWDESETTWRSYDGTTYKTLLNDTDDHDVNGTLTLHSVLEDSNILTGSAFASTQNFDAKLYNILYCTVAATGNVTINFRGNATTTLDSMIAATEILTATVIVTTGSTAYSINAVQVDGVTKTVKWSDGVTPTPVVNSVESYVFTIIKTGSAAFTVLGSKNNYR